LAAVADNGREGDSAMIELTRLNGRPMVVNSDLIKTAEASPDTMLTLINGEKLIVREEISEVVERILVYRARLLAVVARRLHHFHDLERAGALVSLAAAGSSGAPPQKTKQDADDEQ
jgi:flagellar protein FlbD